MIKEEGYSEGIFGYSSFSLVGLYFKYTEYDNKWYKIFSCYRGRRNVDFMRFGVIELTEEKQKIDRSTEEKIVATVDKKTMITNVSVTLQDPKVAAIVADSAVRKLQKSIIGYRTSKAKDDCAYLENLFKERQIEYYDTQKNTRTMWILMII